MLPESKFPLYNIVGMLYTTSYTYYISSIINRLSDFIRFDYT